MVVDKMMSFLNKTLPRILEKIAPKVAAMLIAAFTSGGVLAPLIEKVIAPIIRWLLKKGLDFGTKFLMGILLGDWELAFRELGKSIGKLVNTAVKIMLTPLLLIFGIGMMMVSTTGINVSPVDPLAGNAGYGGGLVSNPPGENKVVRVRKDAIVTLTDGSVITNPKDPIPNGQVTSVKYRIKITP